jgi:hypothetical protein
VRQGEYWPIRAQSLAAAGRVHLDPPTIPPWTFCAAQSASRSGLFNLTSSKLPLGTRPSTGSRCSNLSSASSLYSASISHLPGNLPLSPSSRAVNLRPSCVPALLGRRLDMGGPLSNHLARLTPRRLSPEGPFVGKCIHLLGRDHRQGLRGEGTSAPK